MAKTNLLVPILFRPRKFTLPFSADFTTWTDSALPSPLNGSTWTVSGSAAKCTANAPTELATNPEFTTNTTGWSAANGATLTRRDYTSSPDIDPTGGADNFGIEVAGTGSNNPAGNGTAVAVTKDQWFRWSCRSYSPSANTTVNAGMIVASNTVGGGAGNVQSTEDAWQTLKTTGRSSSTTMQPILRCQGANSGDMVHFDAVSMKQLTLSNTFALLPGSQADAIVKASWTLIPGICAGVVGRMDSAANPQNYWLAYYDGSRMRLDEVNAGVYTNRINASYASQTTVLVELRMSGANVSLYGNSVQMGTTQTDTLLVNNKIHGAWTADAEGVNQMTSFFAVAP